MNSRCIHRTLLAVVMTAAVSRAVTLVKGGKSSYSICLGVDASPSEKRAAQELQRFLEEMSGARLGIVSDDDSARGDLILVGNSRVLERLGLDIPFDSLGPEGFALKTSGSHLVIAGGRQRGAMYGVYTLLDKLGCRWFTPEVSRIPKKATITIGPLDETHRPAFEYREVFFTEAFDKDWAARNRTNGNSARLDESTGGKVQYFPFVHSFYRMIPPEKYFRDHPEYFSLIDGRRRVERGQLCLTNPQVLRLGIEAVERWIQEHPEATILSVSQNDWEGWCECDNCRRVEAEEGGAHSGPVLRYVNALAAEIEKKHPDKLIDTLAYWYTEPPPAKARPRPNVRIRLCPIGVCEAHPYDQCPRSTYFVKNLRAWSQITNQLYIWHYNTNFSHYLLPFPDFKELAASIPMYRRHGVVGLFLEGAYPPGGGGEHAELRSYVMAKQLWDPSVNVSRLVDEFMEGVYGGAARPMRAYFDLLHRQVRDEHIWIFNVPEYSERFVREARNLFRRAESAGESDDVRRRVRKARLPIDYLELLRAKTYSVSDGEYVPADLAGVRARSLTLLADLRGFGIQSIHEGRDLSVDEREFAAIEPYRIATIEHPNWRVDVVPELNGRVIRLIDRRAGRDLLRRVDSGERGYPDAGGLGVFVYPDHHSRALDVKWALGPRTAPDQIELTGTCSNGLRLKRLIQLRADGLHTETVVENPGSAPVEVALQSRMDFGPADIDAASVAYRRQDGNAVERKLIQPEEQPTGSETQTGAARPDGEWWVVDLRARLSMLNRFPKDQVDRTFLSWTAKGPHRVTQAVWSAARRLAPGEILRLDADYGRP